jgi:hypothetical protein
LKRRSSYPDEIYAKKLLQFELQEIRELKRRQIVGVIRVGEVDWITRKRENGDKNRDIVRKRGRERGKERKSVSEKEINIKKKRESLRDAE